MTSSTVKVVAKAEAEAGSAAETTTTVTAITTCKRERRLQSHPAFSVWKRRDG